MSFPPDWPADTEDDDAWDNLVRWILRNVEGFHEELAWLESHTPDEDGIQRAVCGAALRGFRLALEHTDQPTRFVQAFCAACQRIHGGVV